MNKRSFFSAVLGTLLILCIAGCASAKHSPAPKAAPSPKETSPSVSVLRGVYHVHTRFSNDSKASLSQVVKTARKAGLDFVVIADHNNRQGAATYQQDDKSPLLVFGAELSTREGELVALGVPNLPDPNKPVQEIIDNIHEQSGYVFLSHPASGEEPWKNWDIKNYDGFEIYNFSQALKENGGVGLALKKTFLFPSSFLRSFLKTPHTELSLWDQKLKTQKLIGIGAADAHLHKKFLGMNLENYLLQFQAVTVYALASEKTEKAITNAIGQGKTWIAFETRGRAKDFSWVLRDGETAHQIGESVILQEGMEFAIHTSQKSEIRLIRDGQIIQRTQHVELIHKIQAKGTYRVEIYHKGKLWIFTNPIWVE